MLASMLLSPLPTQGTSISSSSVSSVTMRRSIERDSDELRRSSVARWSPQMSAPPKTASGAPTTRTATVTARRIMRTARRRTSPSGGLEPEADGADRRDVPRLVGGVPELAAQPGHVHVEGLGGARGVGPPHLLHDRLAADDGPGVAHE